MMKSTTADDLFGSYERGAIFGQRLYRLAPPCDASTAQNEVPAECITYIAKNKRCHPRRYRGGLGRSAAGVGEPAMRQNIMTRQSVLHLGKRRSAKKIAVFGESHKAGGSSLAFYPTACVSTHAVVLCDMNGRHMPFSPAPTSSSVPLGLIRRG